MHKTNAMEKVEVQLIHPKALQLLLDLEELYLIKVLKKSVQSEQKLSDKYAGKLPVEIGEELQQYVMQSRNEWEPNT